MKRVEQAVLVGSFLAFSWLSMQIVHELGHVFGAWMTKAEVKEVVLYPLIISRTDLGHNPHPSVVVWAGPFVGATLPLFVFIVAKFLGSPGIYLFRFFAGFCLIANGVYVACGPADGFLDTGIMADHGTPYWLMILFGFLTAPLGLYLWHNQAEHFGFGNAQGKVSRSAASVSAALLGMIVSVELVAKSI